MQNNSCDKGFIEQLYCKRKSEVFPVNISVLGKTEEGASHPNIVLLNYGDERLLGYQKLDGNRFCFNEMEYVMSLLGETLSVPMAKVFRVYDDSQCRSPQSIVSISVVQNSNENFVSFRRMCDELFFDFKRGNLLSTEWIESWSRIRARKGFIQENAWEVEAITHDDYVRCLQFPFEIAYLWTTKHELLLSNFGESIERMVAFDILVGQTDRTPSNYGLIVNQVTKKAMLAPLIDSGTLRKPYVDSSQNGFNQMLLDRECLLSTALSFFGLRFSLLLHSIVDSEYIIKSNIYENSDVLNTTEIAFLFKRIDDSLDLIREHINFAHNLRECRKRCVNS